MSKFQKPSTEQQIASINQCLKAELGKQVDVDWSAIRGWKARLANLESSK